MKTLILFLITIFSFSATAGEIYEDPLEPGNYTIPENTFDPEDELHPLHPDSIHDLYNFKKYGPITFDPDGELHPMPFELTSDPILMADKPTYSSNIYGDYFTKPIETGAWMDQAYPVENLYFGSDAISGMDTSNLFKGNWLNGFSTDEIKMLCRGYVSVHRQWEEMMDDIKNKASQKTALSVVANEDQNRIISEIMQKAASQDENFFLDWVDRSSFDFTNGNFTRYAAESDEDKMARWRKRMIMINEDNERNLLGCDTLY